MTRTEIPPSLEVFSEDIKEIVEKIGRDFTEPDDDWMAVLIIESDTMRQVVGLTGELFNGGARKDRLVEMLHGGLLAARATRYAFVLSSWGIHGKEGVTEEEINAIAEEWRGRFEDHPDRTEQLVLHIVDRESEVGYIATIDRHESAPPTLGEWKKVDGMTGRFPSLRDALREED